MGRERFYVVNDADRTDAYRTTLLRNHDENHEFVLRRAGWEEWKLSQDGGVLKDESRTVTQVARDSGCPEVVIAWTEDALAESNPGWFLPDAMSRIRAQYDAAVEALGEGKL
jgi:hypothetical protein